MPLNTWAKQPGRRVTQAQLSNGTSSVWPWRGQGALTAATSTVAQMAMLTARIDRQEAMFEAVLERLSTTLPTASALSIDTMSPSGVGPGIDVGAAAPVIQLATTVPLPAQAPLIIGGVQPDGYIYVGMNQGLSVWGHAEIVAASVTEARLWASDAASPQFATNVCCRVVIG